MRFPDIGTVRERVSGVIQIKSLCIIYNMKGTMLSIYGMMLETKRICQFLDEGDAGWISIRF